MQKACPASDNNPLFCIQGTPVTQVQARAHLKKILNLLHLDLNFHNFHTSRR